MENNISKKNHSWGEEDLDEDKDTLSPFGIKSHDATSRSTTLTGFKTIEPVVTKAERKQKNKGKHISMTNSNSIRDNSKIQQAEFYFSHSPENDPSSCEKLMSQTNETDIRNLTIEDPYLNPESSTISTNHFQSNMLPNVSPNPILLNSQSLLNNANLNYPYIRPMTYQNLLPQRLAHPMYNNPLGYFNVQNIGIGMPNYPHQIPFQTPVSQQLQQPQPVEKVKPLYVRRVEVVESLFKFIVQILKSPDQPSVDQVESMKSLLDSLVVNKESVTK